jgi:hypothetical protein
MRLTYRGWSWSVSDPTIVPPTMRQRRPRGHSRTVCGADVRFPLSASSRQNGYWASYVHRFDGRRRRYVREYIVLRRNRVYAIITIGPTLSDPIPPLNHYQIPPHLPTTDPDSFPSPSPPHHPRPLLQALPSYPLQPQS